MKKYSVRLGNGSLSELSESELRRDLEEGTKDAAERGDIPPLSEDELGHLFEIHSTSCKFVSVNPGKDVILTYDGSTIEIARSWLITHRTKSFQIYEKL